MTHKEQYKKFLERLHELFLEKKADGYEADVIRDQMDIPWYKMSDDDQEEMKKYSAELYGKKTEQDKTK